MSRPADLLTHAQLLDLYVGRGLSAEGIATRLGIHRNSVYAYLKRFEIPRRVLGKHGAQDVGAVEVRDTDILSDFDSNMSVSAIARKHGLSRQGVYNILGRRGR